MQCWLLRRQYMMLIVKRCARKTGSVSVHDGEDVNNTLIHVGGR